MNTYTKSIAKHLQISLAKAKLVQDFIDDFFDFDWSESTEAEIKAVAKEAASTMNINQVKIGK